MVHRACELGIRTGLVVLLIYTPLAFGTVEPWSIAAMEWGIVSLVLMFLLARYYPGGGAPPEPRPAGRRALIGLALPIGVFLVLCVAQTIPLPMRWLRVISPGSARLYESVDLRSWEREEEKSEDMRGERADPLLQLAPVEARPISVNPGRTRDRLKLLVCLVALFFLLANWVDEEKAIFILRWVVVVAFLVSMFGLVQLLTWNGRIYWIRKIPNASTTSPTAFGPFVNHDHFAGYAEMTIPIALSLAFWLLAREAGPSSSGGTGSGGGGWRWGTLAFGKDTGRLSKLSLTLFAAVILIVGLLFSTSRGGILSAFISGSILLALLCRRAASAALRWTVLVALPIVVVLLISWIGAETIRKQLRTYENMTGEASFQLRVILWKRLLEELPAYGWVGSGLGTFEDSFASLTPAGSARRWDRAHNDYLQLLWETGVVGGLLFLAGVVLYAKNYWWPALRDSARPLDLFRVGLAAALLSIALHSGVDFCLQIGANAFLCALLAGILVALHRVAGPVRSARSRPQPVEGPWAE